MVLFVTFESIFIIIIIIINTDVFNLENAIFLRGKIWVGEG